MTSDIVGRLRYYSPENRQHVVHEAAAEIERLRAERDALLRMLAEWCVAVDNDSSWDGWDHHYKYARYRPGPMRAALDAAIQEVIDEQARYDAVLAERKP